MEYDVLCPDVGIYRCFAATQSVREDERVALSFLPSDTPTPVMRVYKSIPTKMKDIKEVREVRVQTRNSLNSLSQRPRKELCSALASKAPATTANC